MLFARGSDATGMVWLNRDGEHRLFKRPARAGQFVTDKAYQEVLSGIDNRTTVLLGHTRWRTRGDERLNRNNHPIRAGDIIGTHNGTIYNADYLFRRFKLPRFAQVDSELLFRLAARAARSGRMDVEWFKERLRRCRGQITAVLASRLDPETRLPAIDRLEGFRPGGSSIYRRVMVAARVETAITPVWLYSMKYRSNWGRVANGRWEPIGTDFCGLIRDKTLDNPPVLMYFR